jgi:GNAT superfamily N-acetyltransferase
LERTREKRPDLFASFEPATDEDRALLRELEKSAGRVRLTEPLSCRQTEEADLPRIMEIVGDARESLRRHGVDQWQGPYPTEDIFLADIAHGESCVILHGAETAAFFTLSTRPEPAYDDIRDGKWTAGAGWCVLHRCAVAKAYRGSGMAEAMLRFVEERARSLGCRSIRVDTHRKNKPMQRMLRDAGYRYRGNITIDSEPGHDPGRQCYEKLLKERRT